MREYLKRTQESHRKNCDLANHYAERAIKDPLLMTPSEARKRIEVHLGNLVALRRDLQKNIYSQLVEPRYRYRDHRVNKREFADLYGVPYDELRVDGRGIVYSATPMLPHGFVQLPEFQPGSPGKFVSMRVLFENAPEWKAGSCHLQFEEPWNQTRLSEAIEENAAILAAAASALLEAEDPAAAQAQFLSTVSKVCVAQLDIFRRGREFESARAREQLGKPIRWGCLPSAYEQCKYTLEDLFNVTLAEVLVSADGQLFKARPGVQYESLVPFLESTLGKAGGGR